MEKSNQENVSSYLTFQIGTEIFGTSVNNVINILEMTKITRIPQALKHMKGVINLRGSILPILDARLKLNLPETEYTTNTCILVLEITDRKESLQLGVIVDNVQEVIELSDADIQPPPSLGTNYQADLINGMTKKDDVFILLIDVNKIFADEAMIDIKEMSS
jgi:purine-binding chemotaxis protein CheW